MKVQPINIKPFKKNTLLGFFDLEMEGLMTINGCTCHCKNTSYWIGLPSKSYVGTDGTTKWQPIIDMPKERLEKLRDLVMPILKAELEEVYESKAPEPQEPPEPPRSGWAVPDESARQPAPRKPTAFDDMSDDIPF